jgi:hypothetical protein
MMQRCYNKNQKAYHRYGGRGIAVCQQWHDVSCFIEWATTNDWAKDLELDRKDNDLGYNPINCHFVTPRKNSNNRRNNRLIEINGRKMTFAEAHRQYGVVSYEAVRLRLNRGWDLMTAFKTPRDNRGGHNRCRS